MYPDEDGPLLKRHVRAMIMAEGIRRPTTVESLELITDALKTLHTVTEAHNFHDISTKLEECMALLIVHVNRSNVGRG